MEATGSSTLPSSLDDLGTIDFSQTPNARSIACFFLGCLFFTGLRQFSRSITNIVVQRLQHSAQESHHSDVEDPRTSTSKRGADGPTGQISLPAGWKSIDPRSTLLAVMALCFTIASALEMTSLLSFAPETGASRCGRFVITAGVLEHLATLLAFVSASIDMRMLGASRWEQRGLFLLLLAAFGLQCAEAGLTTFTVSRLPTLAFGFCWRTRPPTICAVNALIGILCGIYITARQYAAVVPEPTFAWRSQVVTLCDERVARGLSLLSLGVLTFLPGFVSVGIAGDVIPLAIAGTIVLELFGVQSPPLPEPEYDNRSQNAISVQLFPEPSSPTGRSEESHRVAVSPKSLGLSATRMMELNGSQIAVKSFSGDGQIPSPPQSGRPSRSPASTPRPIIPRLAHVMNTAYPPTLRSPSISAESVSEIVTARRVKRPGTGGTARPGTAGTTGRSIRSARPVSFLTNQNPYADRGLVPPSPGSAARTEFEFTTTEDDDALTRTATVSTQAHAVSRNPSSTASHWQGEPSRIAPSSSGRWKNVLPGTFHPSERMDRSVQRRTFGAESQRSLAISRVASNRQSVPPTPTTELSSSRPPVPFVDHSKQLPNVPSP